MTRTTAEVATAIGGTLIEGDPAATVTHLAGVEEAGPGDLTFYENPRFRKQALASRATAMLVQEKLAGFPGGQIVTPGPYLAFTLLARELYPEAPPKAGVHRTAVVEEGAHLDPSASLGPHVTVERGATVGAGAVLMHGVLVGREATIGEETVLHPGVVVWERSRVGRRCRIHAGTVIGEDGFGYRGDEHGHQKIPHFGHVEVGDEVEIGANCTICRGTFGRTVIGKGTKLDNLVHIAHNVRIGERVLIIASTAIAGGAKVGDDVILAGQCGIADHAEIGAGAILGPRTGASGRIPPGAILAGAPSMDHKDWVKWAAARRYLPGLLARVRALEAKLGVTRPGKEER